VNRDGHGTQTLSADELSAFFSESTKAVEKLEARGSAKFNELDRNAIAASLTYTDDDKIVRLRGGEPTYWDSASRAKAPQIDWDTAGQRASLNGGVSTTYYSREKSGNAAPFGHSEKPVFVTSQSADLDGVSETATFVGNSRAWQDNNYVRADRMIFDQRNGRFNADGSVQSLLYEAKQRRRGVDQNVPIYASASSLAFVRDSRLLQYRQSVDIRQGTDRLTADSADIYLNEKNELVKSIVETRVVMTQPGRRATGDWAQYTGEDDIAIVRGNPAQVEDSESGTSQGSQITVHLSDNRVVSEGRTRQNPGARTRSVYKVRETH